MTRDVGVPVGDVDGSEGKIEEQGERKGKRGTRGEVEGWREGGRERERGEGRGRCQPTAAVPSSQGVAATLRNEAISLMEASEG